MPIASGAAAAWVEANRWLTIRRSPFVVVLAGVDSSPIVDAALADTAVTDIALPRFEPACTPPCDALLWRLETASGDALNHPGLVRRHWHRAPYAITLRLVQYRPGSMVPEILDEGTLGTRGTLTAFKAALDRLAMRFVRDAALGSGRGPADATPATAPRGMPGWLDASRSRWRGRLMAEWRGIGFSTVAMDRLLSGDGLGDATWFRTEAASRYLADPFPVPGGSRILCQERPLHGGPGRIVCVATSDGSLAPPSVVLDDGEHHSYPCTLRDNNAVYCVPNTPHRGGTRIYLLDVAGRVVPVCDVAPNSRLADPTLFRWNGRYWLACTDLDVGSHDNLCLLHAAEISGPWTPHARWPVRIDVRGARPAGMLFSHAGGLFRPGRDCAAPIGSTLSIHQITTLSETDFRENLVAVLRPDRAGPFPHGLNTLAHDGDRFWVTGKRLVLEPGLLRRGLIGGARNLRARAAGH